jgi:hypothetical protein
MVALLLLALNLLAALFKSKSGLEAENAALRQQLIVLRRKVKGRIQGLGVPHPSPTSFARLKPLSRHRRGESYAVGSPRSLAVYIMSTISLLPLRDRIFADYSRSAD